MRLPNSTPRPRRGAALIEGAIVFCVTFFLMVGLIVGALGVSRYQQIAQAAREGARFASVSGGQYAYEYTAPATTANNIVDRMNRHLPFLNLAPSHVEVWFNHRTTRGEVRRDPWDYDDPDPTVAHSRYPWRMLNNTGTIKWAVVEVRVTYPWIPEWNVFPVLSSGSVPVFTIPGVTFQGQAMQQMSF
jgi:hypothetical protein